MTASDILDWLDAHCGRLYWQDLPAGRRPKNRVILVENNGRVTGGRDIRNAVCRAAIRQNSNVLAHEGSEVN